LTTFLITFFFAVTTKIFLAGLPPVDASKGRECSKVA